ncbi:MAG TPA: PfkB family carbohydrate kinase [Aggregatilineales bacterium]|nr:PfkB family carbohydrate kinase [Aggregatilineales bacterium]
MQLVTLGEVLIDMFPAEVGRGLTDVSAFHPKPGGAPANVAVAARRLGAASAFIGKVGDDLFGHYLIDVLAGQGVETRGMRVDAEARTTMAIIALPDEHTAEFVFYRNPGADQRLRPDELDRDLLASTRAFHFGSLSLTGEPIRSATREAVALARQGGALVSYDVNYRPPLWPSPQAAVDAARAMLPHVDVLKVNETELALLAGRESAAPLAEDALEGLATGLLAEGPAVVVVTRGQAGSAYFTAAGGGVVPAFQVRTVDSVGCGDAFIAGLLVRLTATAGWREMLAPEHLHDAVRYASAVGALTATRQGVIPALPTAAEVDGFLRERV